MDEEFVYYKNLKGKIHTIVGESPYARVHRAEWNKIMNGDPVEINPSLGEGYKVMTVEEWADRWKQNEEFPVCLACNGRNTKEHHFMQTWCWKKKLWESEIVCLDCHHFTWRSYKDPDFKTPEELEKEKWKHEIVA